MERCWSFHCNWFVRATEIDRHDTLASDDCLLEPLQPTTGRPCRDGVFSYLTDLYKHLHSSLITCSATWSHSICAYEPNTQLLFWSTVRIPRTLAVVQQPHCASKHRVHFVVKRCRSCRQVHRRTGHDPGEPSERAHPASHATARSRVAVDPKKKHTESRACSACATCKRNCGADISSDVRGHEQVSNLLVRTAADTSTVGRARKLL